MNLDQNTKATFYQYQLLKKSIFPKALIQSTLIIPFLVLIAEVITWGFWSIFYFLLAAPIALWIQFVICRSALVLVNHNLHRRWRFFWRFPWIGYMPDQYISYPIYRKTQLYYTWIGIALILFLIPWSPASLTVALIFWHIWLLIPRYFAFRIVQKQRKDGFLKFNEQDVSYYIQ